MLRLVLLAAGVALLVFLVRLLGLERILEMLAQIGWHFLTIAAIYAAYQGMRAAALRRAVLRTPPPPYRDTLWIRLSGEAVHFLTFTGPVLAEPTRAWLLHRRGLTTREAAAAVLTEYLIYTFTSAALSSAGLLYLVTAYDPGPAFARAARIILYANITFLAVAFIAIIRRIYLIGAIVERVSRIPLVRNRVRVDMGQVHAMEDLLLAVLRDRPGRLLSIVALELGAQALLTFEVYWVLRALDLPVTPAEPLVIEAATKFVSLAFFFVPTQMGAAEGAYALVFGAIGLTAAAGFVLAFVRRLRTVLVAAVGLGAMATLTGR